MDTAQIVQELQFKAVRSSGAGGQHVNKVSTKIELTYDLQNSTAVTDKEKERLLLKLSNRLTKENVLLLQCDDSRSQHKNKDLAIKRFLELIKSALIVPKKRKKTKPSRSAIEKRLNTKKKSALKKANRKKPSLE
ncbi:MULTISPECIES: alternative ribosome rescue aminoacyl-tRNA hydrolase ArfB [Cellulophaga]|uniref:Class I peptide chain release factor n=1 Tax=Cellulophaga lytica (strain ATCC 23178 / DSM 7489 / JCM 8516 / NBRC 14961 / NCIMB 1423 / VKM B-1433 / Cy l20) TaxID=867900 RepID=F0RG39_CELLC|nr:MULTISPECIES: alternative ribosome rescue aminoacyl-tRNA hydrolase ArfB [Cellulophaga]ADY29005.1 Class I peptide chain release factor [Cellulophaga lytica DSM 7489]AIM60050.1 peptide chain release factor 1 [Cellulophaga lytica]APU09919.1 peptide chain release factor 1 [Cellulophaga lytica]MDO6854975.1 alternative ribosome rescue aminoacyl-tRNA hydrolase ArfB [Cellulophaga lytica]TVZ08429.1 ribosome-associated protein [Cellulophaga sp. RHA_52]